MNDTPSFRDHKPRARKPRDNQNGHTIILKTAINKKQELHFELMNGSVIRGQVSQFDNYTITILERIPQVSFDGQSISLKLCVPPEPGSYRPRTIFKHAIASFYPAEV